MAAKEKIIVELLLTAHIDTKIILCVDGWGQQLANEGVELFAAGV